MLKEYNKKSLWYGIPGLLVQSAFFFVNPFISLLGTVAVVIGFGYYAKSKGYSKAFGLLGLLSWAGIIILALLKDNFPSLQDQQRKKTEKRDALIFISSLFFPVLVLIVLWKIL